MKYPDHLSFTRLAIALSCACCLPVASAQDEDADDAGSGQVFELSPFEVSTAGDRGYYASNAITGSRIDVRIQDLPMNIEVVTSEFIEDTGSTNLRDSLRYSAGILLQSQNDAFGGGFDSFGNVNNPEQSSADKSNSSFKIRGFVTENTLRRGFRRQHATDTVNIDRIEVVRGPNALLYGVGNFGGVVNYMPKEPLPYFQTTLTAGIGSDNWFRSSLDTTGPLPAGLGYRLTAAWEETDDWTELNNSEHFFVSPVLEWNWKKTKIIADFEYGEREDRAIGFKSVRAPTLEGVPIFEADRLETYGFLEFEGKDPRTFRWSGPDTYLFTDAWNANIELQQGITDDLYLLAGYNHSFTRFDFRDVFGGIATDSAAPRAQPFKDTIQAIQIIDGKTSDVVIPVDNAVLQYNWTGAIEENSWDQVRTELNYSKRLFEGNRWLASSHSLLLGYSWESKQTDVESFLTDSPDGDNWMYKNPTDSSYLRFARQADGSPSLPFEANTLSGNVASNEGIYLVYSARLFKDRLFFVGGVREDTTRNEDGYFETIGSRAGRTFFPDAEVTKRSTQLGVSFEVVPGWTVYGVKSEGVEPNFGGARDGLGRALDSVVADMSEVGLKINLDDGRIAATISVFKIEREGLPFSYWWAPAPARGQFRTADDIIYRMDEWIPANKPDNRYLQAALDEWNAAVASGAVYPKDSEDGRSTFTYLNASTAEGAAFLDKVFAELNAEFALPRDQRTDNDPWPGFLYNGFDDPEVNTAAEDWSTGDFFQTISDQSEGWEAQVIWSPNDAFQLVLNYSNVRREVTDAGAFVTYPYAEGNWDRWATWYFPNTNWGLAGVEPDVAYPGRDDGLPSEDTANWTGIGWGKGEALDDTPEHAISWWGMYQFQSDQLRGLQLGIGGTWESKREYASAFTSAGQKKQNETGTSIKAYTDPRLTISAMLKYDWTFGDDNSAYVQLNVDNALDDTDQYGLVYAPGRSWKLNMGVTF
jgi:outer membrane receptor protein involved in Fe transport